MRLIIAFVLVVSLLASVRSQQPQPLDPFTSAVICANGDVGFQPSTDSSYSFTLQGNAELFDTIEAVVEDGVLYIQSPKPGNSNKGSVVAIISAPKDAINELSVSGNGDVALTGGFTSPTFKMDITGNGDVGADLVVSGAVTVQADGNGDLDLVGSLGSLDLTSDGNGDISVFGISGNADVKLKGNGDVFIGGSPQTVISGSQDGIGELSYSGGSCSVTGGGFDETCQKENEDPESISLPRPSSGSSKIDSSICAKGEAKPSSSSTAKPSSSPAVTTESSSASIISALRCEKEKV
eukprot:jgi/Picsp_1/6729/NSC_04070-R1_unnamed protein product [Sphingobacterium sp. 21]